MKYQARETEKGWQVHLVDDAGQDADYLGFAPTVEEAEKMVEANVAQRKAQRRVLEFDDDGKPLGDQGILTADAITEGLRS